MVGDPIIEKQYAELLESLKSKIAGARLKAILNVNKELILLYWEIGRSILERQAGKLDESYLNRKINEFGLQKQFEKIKVE